MDPITQTYNSGGAEALSDAGPQWGRAWLGPLLMVIYLGIFYLLERITGPLKPVHWLFLSVVGGFYFISKPTRYLVVIGLPVIAYATLYDFFQFIPFEKLLPIHIESIYHWDLNHFGITTLSGKILFHEWIYRVFSNPVLDFLTGVFYLLHVPVVIALIFYFWRAKSVSYAQKFTLAFFLINALAFATYYLLPAAAPWYVEKFGFLQPLGPIPGDPAGLVNFENIIGVKFFSDNYQISPVVFGAIPSMHAGFATLGWLFSFRVSKKATLLLTVYIFGMYFSALYLQHHYLLDVLWGISYAFLAWFMIDRILSGPAEKLNRGLRSLFVDQAGGLLFK